MFAVCVTFILTPGVADNFMPLIKANAQTSLTEEAGCHRFDVLSQSDKPDYVFLYELYTDRAAFEIHLASAHFRSFDTAVTDMIAKKDIRTWDRVA